MDPGFMFINHAEPDSPTSGETTPTAATVALPPLLDGCLPPIVRLKRVGRQVYKEVWDEFYDWEPGYCAEILENIPQSLVASKRQITRAAIAAATSLVRTPDDAPTLPPTQTKNAVVMPFTQEDVLPPSKDYPGGHVHSSTVDVSLPLMTVEEYRPHPKYESCSPASRSALLDPDDLTQVQLVLDFLPYADEECSRYLPLEYQAKYNFLAWETFIDPDEEIIHIETTRRLLAKHDIKTQDIDQMQMFKKIRAFHNVGLQWDQSQRDALHWPGALKFEAKEEKLPVTYCPEVMDLRRRLATNLGVFCPSISCLHSACATHRKIHASTYIPSRKPQITGKDMILSEGSPCGPDCFRHIPDYEKFLETIPPLPTSHLRGSLDILDTVLGMAPNLFPCQLSDICLKPCIQVFAERLQLFPDSSILTPSMNGEASTDADDLGVQKRSKGKAKVKSKPKFVDGKHLSCVLLPACSHLGPCESNICPCWTKKQHCSLMCRCGIKCNRQWPGCSCTAKKCLPKYCDCAKNLRECIPGICLSCDAGVKPMHHLGENGRPCRNTQMLFLASEPVEIKHGAHGFGAFACKDMDSNVFVGTYVGHIMNSDLADCKFALTKHTSHNYLFEVGSEDTGADIELSIFDAAHLGNATRFLNHATGTEANVEAKNVLVIGEHQLGFFTRKRIKKGEELFLNYGGKFWEEG